MQHVRTQSALQGENEENGAIRGPMSNNIGNEKRSQPPKKSLDTTKGRISSTAQAFGLGIRWEQRATIGEKKRPAQTQEGWRGVY